MSRPSIASMLVLLAAAGCKIGGTETTSAGNASCTPVGSACAQNADCCSYGCQAGVCLPNPLEGGTCRTTDDCASRLCKSGACTTQAPGMCRDDADVCGWRYDCCSGNCLGGHCTVNHPPVADAGPNVPDAPYTKPVTLANGSSDPDGDPLVYGWSLVSVPAGSTAALSSTVAANPSFTPDAVGAYVVRLVVTDGPAGTPNRLTSQVQITLDAVNRSPVASIAATPATWSRNVALSLSGAVSDPDGDTLECAWRVTPPGATSPVEISAFSSCGNPGSPGVQYTPTAEGPYRIDLLVRDHDRTTGTIVNTAVASAAFTSVNDAPTPVVSRSPYYANVGATAGTTPAVLLDASGSADTNGDAPLSYSWEMISASDGGALPALSGPSTATPSFVPDRVADFVVRVTVTDPAQLSRAGASSTLDVTVRVGRHVQPLSHDVIDAARATTADKVILGGHDPADASKGMIWVYDLASGTEGAGIRLVDPANTSVSGIPRLVAATADGTRAVVVDASVGVSIWIVNLGATPSMSRIAAPWAIADLVVAGNRYAYLFKANPGTGLDEFRELDLTTGALNTLPWSGYGGFGAAYTAGTTTYLFRVETYGYGSGYWYRYAVNNSGAAASPAASGSAPTCGSYPVTSATAVWPTLNSTFTNSYVVSSCGQVYLSNTLGSLAQDVGLAPVDLDSAANGTVVALEAGGAAIHRFDAVLAPLGTDVLPAWAENGYGRTTYALRAFIDSAASKRVAVIHDASTPARHGVVTFP